MKLLQRGRGYYSLVRRCKWEHLTSLADIGLQTLRNLLTALHASLRLHVVQHVVQHAGTRSHDADCNRISNISLVSAVGYIVRKKHDVR